MVDPQLLNERSSSCSPSNNPRQLGSGPVNALDDNVRVCRLKPILANEHGNVPFNSLWCNASHLNMVREPSESGMGPPWLLLCIYRFVILTMWLSSAGICPVNL